MRTLTALLCLLIWPVTAMASDTTLRIFAGAPAAIPGTATTVQLIALQDQRCPADAGCMWEGMVRADIRVAQGATAPTITTQCNLCDGAGPVARIADQTPTIGRLYPSKHNLARLGRPALLSDYTLTITISP